MLYNNSESFSQLRRCAKNAVGMANLVAADFNPPKFQIRLFKSRRLGAYKDRSSLWLLMEMYVRVRRIEIRRYKIGRAYASA
ncbi:MAG: hypothetical protein U5L45_15510 [Saprospiraceae bacterium]|nr:hypothetical protein [Saprospiraceae bacterium]